MSHPRSCVAYFSAAIVYRFNHRDSAFYAANLAGCISQNTTRAYLRGRYRCALKPVSGAASGQLCLLGPPGPFVVALPRLNLYKWVRALFVSLPVLPSLRLSFPFFLFAFSRCRRRLSKHPPAPSFNQG